MKRRGPLFWLGVGLATLMVVGLLSFRVAVHRLRAGIEQALGPGASVGALDVGWAGVELRDLSIHAQSKGWPAEDELRATKVRVVPELSSLLSPVWRIRSVTIEDAYVSVLRTADGKLRVLPALLEQTRAAPSPKPTQAASAPAASPGPQVRIGKITLSGGKVDFFDASVRKPPHHIGIEQLQAELDHLSLPGLDQAIHIDLKGLLKGPHKDGQMGVAGEFTPATHDAHLMGRLAGVDLVALQPYLLRLNEGGVRNGTLDLDFDATVAKNHLHAPGKITLTGLELGSGNGLMGTFVGVPRRAVIAAMSQNGRIDLKFTLDGRLDDPQFSLNEQLAVRTASGLAEALGVSLGGVVEGVGGLIKGLFGH
jgi:hypothetical protein